MDVSVFLLLALCFALGVIGWLAAKLVKLARLCESLADKLHREK